MQSDILTAEELGHVRELVQQHFGLKVATAQALPGEYDRNLFLTSEEGARFLLKIAPETADPVAIRFQHAMLEHVHGLEPQVMVGKPLKNIRGDSISQASWYGHDRYVHLLHWIPGKPWAKTNPHHEGLLRSLGKQLGRLSKALGSFEHPDAPTRHEWDIARIREIMHEGLEVFANKDERQLAAYFLDMYERWALPHFGSLPRAINYNDANDWNILVDAAGERVTGFIDFGDSVQTLRVTELAIALAYAMMDKADPLAAAMSVIEGYQPQFPLSEKEIEVLFPLAAARLLLSTYHAACRERTRPDNEYLQISRGQAWALLRQLRPIHPAMAQSMFRHAAGFAAHPDTGAFQRWIRENQTLFHPVVNYSDGDRTGRIDLSVGSVELGGNAHFEDSRHFERQLRRLLEDLDLDTAVGGYQEVRPFYTADFYQTRGLEGPQWRTVHLGLDIWQPAGSPVFAPLPGKIFSLADNRGDRNYGPTIILQHHFDGGKTFYTLYGHLDRSSLAGKEAGDAVAGGERLGAIGPAPENGNWPPHLHWQILLDPLGHTDDFPGVGFYRLRRMWRELCPDPESLQPGMLPPKEKKGTDPTAIFAARRDHLGPNLSISYREPLYILRGSGSYLYDHTGRRFLDTVNNVAHVGHEHPYVVRALQRQAAVLNTNTRYLHELLPRYAERLLALFPDELEVVYFVNSGSEANELALRMARVVTGREDVLAMQSGYHGNTGACVDVSAYKFAGKGGAGKPRSTFLLSMPDPLRHPQPAYAEELADLMEKLQHTDRLPAGFIGESILSCGGQVVLPNGFLHAVYGAMRRHGGICIADEVQTGFGRPGSHFWAFQTQGVVPDIVTLGKPIGNGHPLGAVVCTRAVASAFDNGMEYFNTFGGNPVSCAVGLAVLDVIRNEGLQDNAERTGAYLKECLGSLQTQHPIIGQVRGPGLFQGIELVNDSKSLEPATREAAYLINRMRRHSILMSTDGPYENVLKIKPPMVFGKKEVDFLVETLDKVLQEDRLRI